MNLVEQLLKADAKKAEELETGVVKSKQLAKILGEKEPIELEIREIKPRRMNALIAMQFDKKGNFDHDKAFDAKALTILEGVTSLDFKDEKLMEHFKCATPKDLVIKLLGKDLTSISDSICDLGEMEVDEETVKN